jgi:hypothetical protein
VAHGCSADRPSGKWAAKTGGVQGGHVIGAGTLTDIPDGQILVPAMRTLAALASRTRRLIVGGKQSMDTTLTDSPSTKPAISFGITRLTLSEIRSLREHKLELHRRFREIDERHAARQAAETRLAAK